MNRVLQLLTLLLLFVPCPVLAQNVDALKQKAIEQTESIQSLIYEIAARLWDYAETSLHERQSANLLMNKLQNAGFTVERGVAGMPTAFVATYGRGLPRIGIMAEFDALPEVGNEALPERKTRHDNITSGHGCGHNLFGAASVGGAIALKEVMRQEGLKGTIKLFGTPAEETLVGKVYMAKAGVFEELDAAIGWHPGNQSGVVNNSGYAMNNFEVEFFGQAAHAALDPWNGRSALDAVELMSHGVNLMREHVKPTTRIHYVIPQAGVAPNVVPEYTKVWYFVRDVNREAVGADYERILKIAEGAALATSTTHKVHLITGVHEYLINRPIQEALQKNLELVGPPRFTEEEQAFAKKLQKGFNKAEKGFNEEIKPLADKPESPFGGSTDVAEVSWIVPTGQFFVTTAAEGIPWHSWATTACHGATSGRKGALIAAKVIGATGIDLLTRPDLLKEAKAYHLEATDGKPYRSPLPEDQPPPCP